MEGGLARPSSRAGSNPDRTLRDWEQWRSEPDQAALAYLKVIAADARFVSAPWPRRDAPCGERSCALGPSHSSWIDLVSASLRQRLPLGDRIEAVVVG